MQKIRKQRVVVTKNRGNQWTTGRATKHLRNQENFTFKMTPDHHEKAAAIIAATGMKKQQLCDDMASFYFDEYELNPLVATAIADSIFNKESAMKVEKKKRSPDNLAIALWEREVETLQSFLS